MRTARARVPRRPTRSLTNATDNRACRGRLLRCGSTAGDRGRAVDAGEGGVVEAALSGGGGSPQRCVRRSPMSAVAVGCRARPCTVPATPRTVVDRARRSSVDEGSRSSYQPTATGATHEALRARRPSPTAPSTFPRHTPERVDARSDRVSGRRSKHRETRTFSPGRRRHGRSRLNVTRGSRGTRWVGTWTTGVRTGGW